MISFVDGLFRKSISQSPVSSWESTPMRKFIVDENYGHYDFEDIFDHIDVVVQVGTSQCSTNFLSLPLSQDLISGKLTS